MCGALRASDAGKKAVLMGWVNRRRDLGNLIFVDVRDRSGITQVVFSEESKPAVHEKAELLRNEFVIAVIGTVKLRDANTINKNIPTGEVEGVYVDINGVLHGFIRSPQGKYTTYNVPAAGTGPGQGTLPESNDDFGDVAGNYFDANGVSHGFLRNLRGSLTTFDAPGGGTSAGQGTVPSDNSDTGLVTGQLIDTNNVDHGFLLENW